MSTTINLPIELTADNVKLRIAADDKDRRPRKRKFDPVRTIGEMSIALAVPFGVIAFLK